MTKKIEEIRHSFIESMGRISRFWGLGRLTGQLYGLLYLNREPMTLDQMAEGLMVSKGNVSMNIRALKRLGMVEKVWVKADRKDYYRAETDFMDMLIRILRGRQKGEFDSALKAVSDCLAAMSAVPESDETQFLKKRLENIHEFFNFIDQGVFSALYLLNRESE